LRGDLHLARSEHAAAAASYAAAIAAFDVVLALAPRNSSALDNRAHLIAQLDAEVASASDA
jgi:hypothetical protein